jgi:transcriptional antiterminator
MDEHLITALNRIADGIEESNDMLNRIASHYDGIVPVMKRNADRVEEAHNKAQDEFGWSDYLNPKKVFKPQEN